MSNIVKILGADVGHGTTIGVLVEFNKITKSITWMAQKMFPSRVQEVSKPFENVMGQPANNEYSVDGAPFTVDQRLNPEGVYDRRTYHHSRQHAVLTQHLLQVCGLNNGEDFKVITGMPIQAYYRNHEKNTDNIEAKIRNLVTTKVIPNYDSSMIELKDVDVKAEGVGAIFDYLITKEGDFITADENGEEIKTQDMRIAVIDIGDGTTDIAVVNNITEIDHARTASREIGVSDVVAHIRSQLQAKYDVENENDYNIKRLMHEKVYRLRGKSLTEAQINELLLNALNSVYPRLEEFVKSVLRAATDIDRILIVGGGGNIFAIKLRKLYEQAILIKDPQYANARGFAKMGLYTVKKSSN